MSTTITCLYPQPVSSRQFHYDATTRTFVGEISETHGFGRVWADSCDEGLTIVSARTGNRRVFVVDDEVRDAEGDTLYWTLKSVQGNWIDGDYVLTLFND